MGSKREVRSPPGRAWPISPIGKGSRCRIAHRPARDRLMLRGSGKFRKPRSAQRAVGPCIARSGLFRHKPRQSLKAQSVSGGAEVPREDLLTADHPEKKPTAAPWTSDDAEVEPWPIDAVSCLGSSCHRPEDVSLPASPGMIGHESPNMCIPGAPSNQQRNNALPAFEISLQHRASSLKVLRPSCLSHGALPPPLATAGLSASPVAVR